MKYGDISDACLNALDEYIVDEIVITGRDVLTVLGKVMNNKQDASINPIGKKNSNPILDTRIYELDFPDKCIEEFLVNVLAKNLSNHTESDSWYTGMIDEVIDIKKYY